MLEDKYINRIYNGDVIEELKKIPNYSIDCIFADPPYFLQTEGDLLRYNGQKFAGVNDEWDKFSNYEEYDNFSYLWLKECKRILKPNGTIWVIGSFQNIYRIGYLMQNLGFWILNDIIWSKPNAVPNFLGTRFKNSHETILWCSQNKNSKFTFNYKTMKFINNGIQEKSIWDISICIGKERIKDKNGKKVHSTQKPEKLLEKIILSSTKPNDIILDPFFGTGTTGAIAKKYGRNWIGIEKEKKYIQVAKLRINKTMEEKNDFSELKLETKPLKISMKKLLDLNKLILNEFIYDKNGLPVGKIVKNGHILDENGQQLSIHKMSAKKMNKINNNGWYYFFIKRNEKMILINDLRKSYDKDTI